MSISNTLKTYSYPYNDIKLNISCIGYGKPLIILHGWGTNGKTMLGITEKLKSHYSCFLLDLPGFGNSPPPNTPWTVQDYAICVANFIQSLQQDNIHILAHSFGARITIRLCVMENIKNSIKKIIITGGAGMKTQHTLNYYLKRSIAIMAMIPNAIIHSNKYKKWIHQSWLWKKISSADYQNAKGVMRDILIKTIKDDITPFLPQIEHQILLIWGENDMETPLYQGKYMEKHLKNAALVTIPNAGHYTFIDQPYTFNRIISKFFDG